MLADGPPKLGRKVLRADMSDDELRTIFDEIDTDRSGMLDVEEAMKVVDHGHAALRTDVAALEVVVGREAIKRGKARRLINGSTSKELLAATPSRGTPTSMTGRVESFLGKMAI